jgi:peptidyl-prolyl cis-trans isomerase SurA
MTLIKSASLILLLTASTMLLGQDNSKSTLFTLGDQDYNIGEFEYYFLKNTEKPDAKSAKSQVNDYLKLYIDFRLKVQEAISLGMDKDEAFVQELEGYREQLLEPYLMESQINESIIQEAYDRLQYEVSGSHILLKAPKNATPEDTLKVYNQLLDYKKRIEEGADFGQLAMQYSDDHSARQNKGYLGYFTAMQMVYSFESAAYNNSVGDLVGPFKTQFGYHLLRIEDKRPARGQVSAAHIMVRFDPNDQDKAQEKAQSIYDNLQKGMDWDQQCRLYSDDQNTAKNGGQLRWFGTGQLVPEFEDAAFALETVGSISEPVKTQFGWHIIKLLDKKRAPQPQ